MGKIADCIRGVALPEQKKIKVLALDQEFSDMEAEIKTLKSENLHLRAQVKPLEREIERLKKQMENSSACGNLKFDQVTGTYVDASTGLRYYMRCLSENKSSPLQHGQYGWNCNVCGKEFRDPSRPLPQVRTDYDPFNS